MIKTVAMKATMSLPFCTCDNQHLLTPGHRCDQCGALVPEQAPVKQPVTYGPEYFEAIEDQVSREGLAA